MSAFTIVPKGNWKSQGSEKEIRLEALPEEKARGAKVHFAAKRETFITRRATTNFQPHNAGEEGPTFLRPSKETKDTYVNRLELDVSVQAVKAVSQSSTQTAYHRKVNAAIQAQPEVRDARIEPGKEEPEMDPAMRGFFNKVMPRMMHHLLQSQEMTIFHDNYTTLTQSDAFVAGREDNFLREAQNSDPVFIHNRQITCVDWKPQSKSVVVVTSVDRCPLETRLRKQQRVDPSRCIVWSFNDQANLQFILRAPAEILVAKFNPAKPNIIVGGLINGQVVKWDTKIAPAVEEKNQVRRRNQAQNEEMILKIDDPPQLVSGHTYESFADREVSSLEPCMISRLEGSHKRPVHDLRWIPDQMEVGATDGKLAPAQEFNQFATISEDGYMAIWDLRPDNLSVHKRNKLKNLAKVGDEPWVPMHKYQLQRPDGSGDIQGLRLHLESKAPGSNVPNYTMCCTSTEGEFCECHWGPKDEQAMNHTGFGGGGDDGRNGPKLMRGLSQAHAGPGWDIHQHPSIPEYYLTVGGWGFKVWKTGLSSPILSSPSDQAVLCGRWSPTRPGLVFIGTAEGRVQVWDLVDRSHAFISEHEISSEAVSVIEFRPRDPRSRNFSQQQVVFGTKGMLHLYELPRVFIKPVTKELENTIKFFVREARRVEYFQWRWKERQKESDLAHKKDDAAEENKDAGEEGDYVFTEEDDAEFKQKVKDLRSSGDDDDDEEADEAAEAA